MDIPGQIALVRRIQSGMTKAAHKLHKENRNADARACEDQVDGLDCVLTSLYHLQNIRNASAVLISEVRDTLDRLPMSQVASANKEKKP